MSKPTSDSPNAKSLMYNCHVCEAPAPDHYHFGGNNLLNLLSQLTYTTSYKYNRHIYNLYGASLSNYLSQVGAVSPAAPFSEEQSCGSVIKARKQHY